MKTVLQCLIEKEYTRGLVYMGLLSVSEVLRPTEREIANKCSSFNMELISRVGRSNTKIVIDNSALTVLTGASKKPQFIQTNKDKDEARLEFSPS